MCNNHYENHERKVQVIQDCYDDFVNLHLHTAYSLLDGMSKPENVIQKVVSIRQKAVAVTEHGNLFSAVKIHKLAEENNIKHIYGMEAYITEDRFVKDKEKKYYHITLLAENEQGRLNLNKLSSLGFIEGFYFKPRIDHKLLEQYKEGIIILSGCMASEIQQALAGGKIGDGDIHISDENYNRAKSIAKQYQKIHGKNYYMEVQAHKDPRQQLLNRKVIDIALELNIPYVATTDSHMVEEVDHELHSIFIQIGTNREAGETYDDTFIMTAQEVYDRLPSLSHDERTNAIKESLKISDRCNVKLPLSEPVIPHVPIPKEYESEVAYLKQLVNKGWVNREIHKKPKDVQKVYRDRLMYEFNAIEEMGFEGYFLLVYSYVNSVKRRGIARGSAGGSLVCYLIKITEIDPIPFDLYFERFIDVGALELLRTGEITRRELKIPDVDSDFSPKDRDKVIDFIVNRYGENKFASIGQFGYIWDKSAIKDVGKVLGIPYDERNKMTQQLGDSTIEFARETGQLKEWFKKYPKLFEYAEKLAGIPKSFGVHPCGKIVSTKDIDFYTGVASNDGTIVFQGDMDDTDALGLVKADVLGLKSLDVIYDCLEAVNEDYDYINPDKLDYKDPKVLEIFKNGYTSGVFQFESLGMQETLKQMQPDDILDLGVANALFRPSSMKHIEHYAKRKNGLEKYTFLHDDLKDVLGDTNGIFVFQEQLITLGRIAGMRNPDLLRQATGKKNMKKMEKAKKELFEGLRKRNWNDEQLETLWQIMIDFASYSFNKSHAMAYAIIAFQMAKLKAYHPKEFMVALLNVKIFDREEVAKYVNECVNMGIKVLPPDINESDAYFKVDGDAIRFGLLGIKGIGLPTVETIKIIQSTLQMSTDGEQNEFTSMKEFYELAELAVLESKQEDLEGNTVYEETMIAKDAMINLIKSGAFGLNRNELLMEFADITYTPLKYKERQSLPARSDFNKLKLEISEEDYKDKAKRHKIFVDFKYQEYIKKDEARKQRHIDEFKEKYIRNEKFYDFDMMGCYISLSPFDGFKHKLKDLYEYENGANKILIMGTILTKEVKKSGRGGQYAKLSIVSPFGVYQGKSYSATYIQYKDVIEKGETIVALVKRNGDEFVISKLMTFKEWKDNIAHKKAMKAKREARLSAK